VGARAPHHGTPDEILTDNGKCFTGRFGANPTEVLFDRILHENGISHRHTGVRSPHHDWQVARFSRKIAEEWTYRSLAAALSDAGGDDPVAE
jgi:hypothetical protein